jgi:hypothetical protein
LVARTIEIIAFRLNVPLGCTTWTSSGCTRFPPIEPEVVATSHASRPRPFTWMIGIRSVPGMLMLPLRGCSMLLPAQP